MEKISNSKKLLIQSLTFPPDQVSTAYIYGDIALKFAKEGWNVEVFTSTPHYNYVDDFRAVSKFGVFTRKTDYYGIKVRHFYQSKAVPVYIRGLLLFAFHFVFMLRAIFGPKFDIILTPSPPLTAGFLAGLVAKLRGAKAVYNIQEIYPDILKKSFKPLPKSLWVILKWIEKKTYDWSARVVVIDPLFKEVVQGRMNHEKIKVIPNFVDIELYKPISQSCNIDYNFGDKFIVAYFGNLGAVQDWDVLIDVMDCLKSETQIMLLLVGGGSEYKRLAELAESRANILIMPYQSRNKIPALMSRSDLHIISMNEASDYDGLPSKALTILSSGKPILAATAKDTPLARLIKESGNGVRVNRGDTKSIVSEIQKFFHGERMELSCENGRQFIIDNYSKEVVTNEYLKLLNELI